MNNDRYPYDILECFQQGCSIAKARNKYHDDGERDISRDEMAKILKKAFPKYSEERIKRLVDFEMDDFYPTLEEVFESSNTN